MKATFCLLFTSPSLPLLLLSQQAARRPLESEHGDPFMLLNAYDEWIQVHMVKNIDAKCSCVCSIV